MKKNVAGQRVSIYAFDKTTLNPKTGASGSIDGYISKDGGAATAADDAVPTEVDSTYMPGIYTFDLTQAETNCDHFVLQCYNTDSSFAFSPVQIHTRPEKVELLAGASNYNVLVRSFKAYDQSTISMTVNSLYDVIKGWTSDSYIVQKSQQFDNLAFRMTSNTDGKTGVTGISGSIDGYISKDGGALAPVSNAINEIGLGMYEITLTVSEMNADTIVLVFQDASAMDATIYIRTQS